MACSSRKALTLSGDMLEDESGGPGSAPTSGISRPSNLSLSDYHVVLRHVGSLLSAADTTVKKIVSVLTELRQVQKTENEMGNSIDQMY